MQSTKSESRSSNDLGPTASPAGAVIYSRIRLQAVETEIRELSMAAASLRSTVIRTERKMVRCPAAQALLLDAYTDLRRLAEAIDRLRTMYRPNPTEAGR